MDDRLKKVTEAVARASDPIERVEELISRMPEGHEAVELLAEIDRNALSSPACSLTFYTILDTRKFADRLVRMQYDQLLIEMAPLSEELVRLWNTIAPLAGDSRSGFLAKASLILEAACLAWQDSKNSAKMSGASVLLPLCSDDMMETQYVNTDSGSWPRGIWGKMEEVLEELDFTCDKEGTWQYRIDLDNRARLISGSNIRAYVKSGATTLSPLALARLSQNLVTRLSLLQRTVSMYPADHPSIGPTLSAFIELLGSFADSEAGIVAVTILGGELMVNNVKIKSSTKAIQNFLAHLTERRINSISFQQGLESDELFAFIELINRKPAQIRDRGGLVEMCRTRGIENISIDEFRYALVAKDGQLVSQTVTGALDSTLEDLVFKELIDRLQHGDSIRDIPPEQLGEALGRILEESAAGSGKYRSMLADFVATLDPTILEEGVLVSRELQKTLAWTALRKIIDKNIEDLGSSNQDRVLDALDKLNQLACIGAERGKTHTVLHVIDNIRKLLQDGEVTSDALFASLILMGSVCERLISAGRMSSAAELVTIITETRLLQVSTPNHASALRRGLSEAFRRIDTPDAADVILQAFMDADESRYHAAEKITAEVMFRNLGMRLVDLFLERKREIRARAYSVLRRFGAGYLLMFHSRIDEIERGGLSVRDRETGRFSSQDWYILRNLISLLGDLESPRSLPLLERLCDDSDDRVRKLALLSLMKVDKGKAISFAGNMIGDPSPDVVAVAVDILTLADQPDRGLIPSLLRLMHTLPTSRKTLMRFFIKVYDDEHVMKHFRSTFSHTKGIPYENEELMQDALAVFIRSGKTEDIKCLSTYHDRNSGGALKKAAVPESVLSSVTAAIDMIRMTAKKS